MTRQSQLIPRTRCVAAAETELARVISTDVLSSRSVSPSTHSTAPEARKSVIAERAPQEERTAVDIDEDWEQRDVPPPMG